MGVLLQLTTHSWGRVPFKLQHLKFCRNIHSKSVMGKMGTSAVAREYDEIEIKVPWGHLAAKWWGTKLVRPIVGVHGWQDNCGTFDTLAPLLPDHVGFLAIDWPGHGLSSRIPDGLAYNYMDHIYLLRLLMKTYKWEKISILGHSLSSSIGFTFSAMFPDKVDMVIGIDMLKPLVRPPDVLYQRLVKNMEAFITADERNQHKIESPSYSHEECIERLYVGAMKSIDREKCFHILDRNLEKSKKFPNKFYFSRDNRLKFSFGTISQELCAEMASKITCPYLFIKAKQSPYVEDERNFQQVLDIMRKSNPNFEYRVADGKHHVHLNEPEKVSSEINDFIRKYRPADSVYL